MLVDYRRRFECHTHIMSENNTGPARRRKPSSAARKALQREGVRKEGRKEREAGQPAARLVSATEARSRAIREQVIFGVAVTDLNGHFLEVNPAYCRITGYSEQDLLATDFSSITHPDDRAENAILRGQALAGQIPGFVVEKRYVRKDGVHVWVRNAVSLIRDAKGRADSFLALTYDLTDRKEMEQELRRRKDELTSFFEHASIGLHWVGPDGIVQWANPAELAMLGYAREEYEGRHIAEFHVDQDVITDILDRLARGEPSNNTRPDSGARMGRSGTRRSIRACCGRRAASFTPSALRATSRNRSWPMKPCVGGPRSSKPCSTKRRSASTSSMAVSAFGRSTRPPCLSSGIFPISSAAISTR